MLTIESHQSAVRPDVTHVTLRGEYLQAIKFGMGYFFTEFMKKAFGDTNAVVLTRSPHMSLNVFCKNAGDTLELFKPHTEQKKASQFPKYENDIILEGTRSKIFMCDVWTLHELFESGFSNIDIILSVGVKTPEWVDPRLTSKFANIIEVVRNEKSTIPQMKDDACGGF